MNILKDKYMKTEESKRTKYNILLQNRDFNSKLTHTSFHTLILDWSTNLFTKRKLRGQT